MGRAVVLMMDSFGIGSAPDAERFGDAGADTLGHIAAFCAGEQSGRGPLELPNLARLGLMHAARASAGVLPAGCQVPATVIGAHGYAAELSSGKDTPSGHWELAGVPVHFDWGYFPERERSFPPALLDELVRRAELPGVLGNCHASGTRIIAELGEAHMRTGEPIVYTSADSVFQIAAHEESFGLERLYALCAIARELVDEYRIARVIARPFEGQDASGFTRTGNRRDLTTPPHEPTLLDALVQSGGEVIGIGKTADIFAGRGFTRRVKATGNEALFDATLEALREGPARSLVFPNFVDFDTLYGHRRDPAGYAAALEAFDARVPELLEALGPEDLAVLCADHGCDPTWSGSDHTREHIPVLAVGARVEPGDIGARDTFADIGQSLAAFFELAPLGVGRSFLAGARQ